jgi:hypothetical protein
MFQENGYGRIEHVQSPCITSNSRAPALLEAGPALIVARRWAYYISILWKSELNLTCPRDHDRAENDGDEYRRMDKESYVKKRLPRKGAKYGQSKPPHQNRLLVADQFDFGHVLLRWLQTLHARQGWVQNAKIARRCKTAQMPRIASSMVHW